MIPPGDGKGWRGLPIWRMLQFFADDSRQDNPPLFVMAGYLAGQTNWDQFAIDWNQVLEAPPRLPRLKTKKIGRELGAAANQKLSNLYAVIERHVRYGVATIVRPGLIKEVFPKDRISSHPFYCSAMILMSEVAGLIQEQQLEIDDIEFVFDEQLKEKRRLLDAWMLSVQHFKDTDNRLIRAMLLRTPRFETDDDCIQVQAADLLAWWVRRHVHQQFRADDVSPISWSNNEKVLYKIVSIGEQRLRSSVKPG